MFVTPNLCNDGHDAVCVGPNVEGTHAGGLVSADLWLKHWMPMILASPAYRTGKMLVVVTFDESGLRDARACPASCQAECDAPSGPNCLELLFQQRFSRLFGLQTTPTAANVYPGGGQVGAVIFNRLFVVARLDQHDRRLQSLLGAPQLRRPARHHRGWRRRLRSSRFRCAAMHPPVRRRRVQRLAAFKQPVTEVTRAST